MDKFLMKNYLKRPISQTQQYYQKHKSLGDPSVSKFTKFVTDNPEKELKKKQLRRSSSRRLLKQTNRNIHVRSSHEVLSSNASCQLNTIINNFNKNNLNIKNYDRFLLTPSVKTEYKVNSHFAKCIQELNGKIIFQYAATIAGWDQELFLEIPRAEILSPWNYDNSEKIPKIKNFIDNFNNISQYVLNQILASSVEKRIIVLERWILICVHLLKDFKDYNGFQAVGSALCSAAITRLSNTINNLSPHAQEILNGLPQTLLKNLISCALDHHQPAIPPLAQFMSEFTFVHDGNAHIRKIKDEPSKQLAIIKFTEAGMKRIHAFDMLQTQGRKNRYQERRDKNLENILREMLITPLTIDQEEIFNLSRQFEPLKNESKIFKCIHLFPSSISFSKEETNQPTMRHLILKKILLEATHFLNRCQRTQYIFAANHTVAWEEDEQNTSHLNYEKDAYISALIDYLKDDNTCAAEEGKLMLTKLREIDLLKIKNNQLVAALSFDLKEISNRSDNANDKLNNIEKNTDQYTLNDLKVISQELDILRTNLALVAGLNEQCGLTDIIDRVMSLTLELKNIFDHCTTLSQKIYSPDVFISNSRYSFHARTSSESTNVWNENVIADSPLLST